MPPRPGLRSPLNEAFGKFIEQVQKERAWGPEFLAGALDLSRSYFRTIELGARNLAPRVAAPLAKVLGAEFRDVSALLALIDSLDIRSKARPSQFDLGKILKHAADLKVDLPAFADLLDWLMASLRAIDKGTYSEQANVHPGMEHIKRKLFATSSRVESHAQSPADELTDRLGDFRLSPVFADAIETLAKTLELYAPLMKVKAFHAWETTQRDRVKEIRSYVTSISLLLEQAADFDWGFLRNDHRPQVTIFMDSSDRITASTAQRKLHDILRPRLRDRKRDRDEDVTENLHVCEAGKSAAWMQSLYIDVVQRAMPEFPASVRDNEQKKKDWVGQWRPPLFERFANAWVYKIRVASPDITDSHERFIGYLGQDIHYTDRTGQNTGVGGLVVAMDRDQVRHCWQTFQRDGGR